MAFVAEILACAKKTQTEALTTRIRKIIDEAAKYKVEVINYLDSVYVRFEKPVQTNKILAEKLVALKGELADLKNNDLSNTTLELSEMISEIEKAEIALSIAEPLVTIHEACIRIYNLEEEGRYADAMKEILNAKYIVNSISNEDRLEVVFELVLNFQEIEQALLDKLENKYFASVIIDGKCDFLKVKSDIGEVQAILSTLALHGPVIEPLRKLTYYLWNFVFVPIVDHVTEVQTISDLDGYTLLIKIVKKERETRYGVVFRNLHEVLQFLTTHFNQTVNDNLSVLEYIGRDLRDKLSELIIKHCLENTIPRTSQGLQHYHVVIEETEKLECALIESGIFLPDMNSLSKYVKDIDSLYTDKKCQVYLQTALVLMKKNLDDTVDIGDTLDSEAVSPHFPKCRVSKSCIALLEMAEKLLVQCTGAPEETSAKFLHAVQDVFSVYATTVSEYHSKVIKTFPQQVAIYYNNCHYIAYTLNQWNETFKGKINVLLLLKEIFVGQPHKLRTLANDLLSDCVKQAITQINETLKECGLQKLQTATQLEPSVEKAVRQCLRQQELLKTIWHKVLPYNMYNKTLGIILDSMCVNLIQALLEVEDISSSVAEQVIEVYKIAVNRGPKLFSEPGEVSTFVANWDKFNELIFVLGASLVEIGDRWANGKGKLAHYLKPTEMKRLIHALFQNTEQRAALLSLLRD